MYSLPEFCHAAKRGTSASSLRVALLFLILTTFCTSALFSQVNPEPCETYTVEIQDAPAGYYMTIDLRPVGPLLITAGSGSQTFPLAPGSTLGSATVYTSGGAVTVNRANSPRPLVYYINGQRICALAQLVDDPCPKLLIKFVGCEELCCLGLTLSMVRTDDFDVNGCEWDVKLTQDPSAACGYGVRITASGMTVSGVAGVGTTPLNLAGGLVVGHVSASYSHGSGSTTVMVEVLGPNGEVVCVKTAQVSCNDGYNPAIGSTQ